MVIVTILVFGLVSISVWSPWSEFLQHFRIWRSTGWISDRLPQKAGQKSKRKFHYAFSAWTRLIWYMYRARSETVLDSSMYTQNCFGQERSEHHMCEFKELLNAIIGCTLQTALKFTIALFCILIWSQIAN